MSTIIEHRLAQIESLKAKAKANQAAIVKRQNRVVQAQPIEVIHIDDEWTPPHTPRPRMTLVDYWRKGREYYRPTDDGFPGVILITKGAAHYDVHYEIRAGRIGAIYAGMFGPRAVSALPEIELMVAAICQRIGCKPEEV